MNKRLVLFLSLLMNIAAFSQQTDTLQIVRADTLRTVQKAQENQDESVFKGRFSDSIDEIWELRESYKRGTFSLRAYRPNYIILSRYSTNPNTANRSEYESCYPRIQKLSKYRSEISGQLESQGVTRRFLEQGRPLVRFYPAVFLAGL